MRHLLDAHALIFALDDPSKHGKKAVAVLENPDSQLLISVGTIWELAIKTGLGILTLSLPCRQWMERALADLDLAISTMGWLSLGGVAVGVQRSTNHEAAQRAGTEQAGE